MVDLHKTSKCIKELAKNRKKTLIQSYKVNKKPSGEIIELMGLKLFFLVFFIGNIWYLIFLKNFNKALTYLVYYSKLLFTFKETSFFILIF